MVKPLRHDDPHRWPGRREPTRAQVLFALLLIAMFGVLIVSVLMNGG